MICKKEKIIKIMLEKYKSLRYNSKRKQENCQWVYKKITGPKLVQSNRMA